MKNKQEVLNKLKEVQQRGDIFLLDIIARGSEMQIDKMEYSIGGMDTVVETIDRPKGKKTHLMITPYHLDNPKDIIEIIEEYEDCTTGISSVSIELVIYSEPEEIDSVKIKR